MSAAASVLLTYHYLDLRKKLELLDIVLKSRGFDESKTFNRIHTFHDLRNVFAHWPFSDYGDGDRDGISCDYIDKKGTDFAKPGLERKITSLNMLSLTPMMLK
jgi:hypothetical protein